MDRSQYLALIVACTNLLGRLEYLLGAQTKQIGVCAGVPDLEHQCLLGAQTDWKGQTECVLIEV